MDKREQRASLDVYREPVDTQRWMLDKHHPLNTRRHWTATKEAARLRSMYLFPLRKETHQDLHRECAPVPLLGYYALLSVLKNVQPNGDPEHDLNDLVNAIDISNRSPRAHEIEVGVGELAIQAIQMQMPFILGTDSTIIDLKSRGV